MKLLIFIFSFVISLNALSKECNEDYVSEMNRFKDNENGTISDLVTGLMWQKCALGQSWSGAHCEGQAEGYSDVKDALAVAEKNVLKGYFDWRLPNSKELYSLVNAACRPAVYNEFEPLIINAYVYVSSTLSVLYMNNVKQKAFMGVDFSNGTLFNGQRGGLVRLVREDK